MRRSDSYRATWLPEDNALLEYDEAMRSLCLLLAATLALSSCSPPPYPKQYKDLEGEAVSVHFTDGTKAQGWLTRNGTLQGYTLDSPFRTPEDWRWADKTTVIVWDHVQRVRQL